MEGCNFAPVGKVQLQQVSHWDPWYYSFDGIDGVSNQIKYLLHDAKADRRIDTDIDSKAEIETE